MAQNTHLAPTDILRGENVYLRLPCAEELGFIRALWGDPETMASVGGPVNLPETEAHAWYARLVEPGSSSNCYCLILDMNHVPVGEISFHHWDSETRSATLNVKIHAAHRDHGYTKDAVRTFLDFFFGRVGGRTMSDDVAVDNEAGRRLLESMGFERDESVSEVCRMVLTIERMKRRA